MAGDATERLPTFYIPHGAGPCFFMEWTWGPADSWHRLAQWLRGLAGSIGTVPKAIVVISAHWEEQAFTVTTQDHPPLLYDYDGFPEHTYRISYPAPGSPPLAREILSLAAGAGIPAYGDAGRGFDHGVFVPFKLIYPNADVPIVQLSLRADLDPATHLDLGRAIAPLRRRGILIVGSGMSYHNLSGFDARFGAISERFGEWLTEAIGSRDPGTRDEQLRHWAAAPGARAAHPRAEHLLPLMVAAGAATGDPGRKAFTDRIMGVSLSAFRFGDPA